MNLASTILVYGGGPGSGCHGPNCGRPRGSGGSYDMVSPNVQEGTKLADALRMLQSPRHKQFAQLAKQVVGKVAPGGRVEDAIGDWKDGAEDSVLITSKAKQDSARYIAASLGIAGNQKMVIPFTVHKGGADTMWTLNLGKERQLADVSKHLDSFGIENRTMVPNPDGSLHVHVFDQGSKLEKNIVEAGTFYGAQISKVHGQGELLGSFDSRADGVKQFRQVVSEYEAQHPGKKLSPNIGLNRLAGGAEYYYGG